MSNLFAVSADGTRVRVVPTSPVRAADPFLHNLLRQSPELLRGDQITGAEDLRWLLIKSEMAIPGPAGATDPWTVDLCFIDHHGIPTFVECKRALDSRVRRETIGQMLDYAANGRHYWPRGAMRTLAESTHLGGFRNAVAQLLLDGTDHPDGLFSIVEDNLRRGRIRLVFFVDHAPAELRSIVEFLNEQMVHSEVLIVEAKSFGVDNQRFVMPELLGYTDQARLTKKLAATARSGQAADCDERMFFDDAAGKLPQRGLTALRQFYGFLRSVNAELRWEKGTAHGSFHAGFPNLSPLDPWRGIFTMYSSGVLTLNFQQMAASAELKKFGERLNDALSTHLNFQIPDVTNVKHASIKPEIWAPRIDALLMVLSNVLEGTPIRRPAGDVIGAPVTSVQAAVPALPAGPAAATPVTAVEVSPPAASANSFTAGPVSPNGWILTPHLLTSTP